MGADGHIIIWKDEDVRKEWPDCDDLFSCLPTHYEDTLNGIKYHHCYWGDNLYISWSEDWFARDGMDERRIAAFANWLYDNYEAEWEVWT